MDKPEVIFLSVQDNKSKLGKIMGVIYDHYVSGERVLVRLPDEKAVAFLDDHLWQVPNDSFLPHEVAYDKSDEAVVLTTANRNLNDATILVHLCPEPSAMALRYRCVYDLKDETNTVQLERSRERYKAYRERGFTLQIA